MIRNIQIKYYLLILLVTISVKGFSQNFNAEQIYENFKDVTVVIISYGFDGNPLYQGSGVIINDSGYVVTNYHNFENSERILVKYKDEYYSGDEIIGADILRDLLIIKLKGKKFHSIKQGNLKNIKVGQKVFALGTPLGLENTLSEGIISRIEYNPQSNRNLIQISAPITHGSSGGALINEKGELIGITTSGLGEANIYFAIPISELANVSIFLNKQSKNFKLLNLFYRGINAYSSGYYHKSIEYFDDCLKIDSTLYFVYYKIGLSNERLGVLDTAINYFNLSIKKNPKFGMAYGEIGYVNILLGKYDEAELMLKKAIQMDENLVSAYNNIGAVYINKKKYDKSMFYLNKAIKLNKFYDEAYGNLGVTYRRLKQYDKAIKTIKRSIEINPNSDLSYYNLGLIYQDQNDYYKAAENYEKVIKLNDKFIRAYINLSLVNRELGDCDNSIKILNKALYLYQKNIIPQKGNNKDLIIIYMELGESNFCNKNFKNALEFLNKGLEIDTNNVEIYIAIALTYQRLKDPQNELLYIDKAINKDPSYSNVYATVGNSYLDEKNYELAVCYYLRYLKYNNNIKILYNLGSTYFQSGKIDSSKIFLENLLKIDSTYGDAYNLLGLVNVQKKDYETGINNFLKAISFGSNKTGVYYNLGDAYCRKGEIKKAIRFLKKSAELGNKSAKEYLDMISRVQKDSNK